MSVDEIIEKYKDERGSLIQVLQDIQRELKYLPKDILKKVSEKLNVPYTQVYNVATFYKSFSLEKRGENYIRCCLGTACHLKGGPRIVEAIERELKIKQGETTKDLKFTLKTVRCVGCCSLAPVINIDGKTFGRVKQKEIPQILKDYK